MASTVRELAQIARDTQGWVNEMRYWEDLPPSIARKIELLCKAVIEYDMLLNDLAPEMQDATPTNYKEA